MRAVIFFTVKVTEGESHEKPHDQVRSHSPAHSVSPGTRRRPAQATPVHGRHPARAVCLHRERIHADCRQWVWRRAGTIEEGGGAPYVVLYSVVLKRRKNHIGTRINPPRYSMNIIKARGKASQPVLLIDIIPEDLKSGN